MNVPLPPVTAICPRFCQVVGKRAVVPHTVACAAPGAVNPNCTCPPGSRIAEPELITGTSTMLNAPLNAEMAVLVVLRILME